MPSHDPATTKHEELLKAIHAAAQLIAGQIAKSLNDIGRAYKPDDFPVTPQNAPPAPPIAVSMPPRPDPASLDQSDPSTLSSASASGSVSLTSTTVSSVSPAPGLFTPVLSGKTPPPAPGPHTPLTTLESDSKPSKPTPVSGL